MRIHHIYLSPAHVYFGHHGKPAGLVPMQRVAEVECVAGKGLLGDRFFEYKENYKGQITFFSMATYEDLCRQFNVKDKDPSVFRRNALVSGEDLNSLIGR